MMKRKILDILFWIFLIIGIIMIIWKVLGNSPSDLEILAPFIVMSLIKIWSNSDRVRDVRHEVNILSVNIKSSFRDVKKDFDRIENKIDLLNKK